MPNQELVDMIEASDIADTDILYSVINPGGAKADRSITKANFLATIPATTMTGNLRLPNLVRLVFDDDFDSHIKGSGDDVVQMFTGGTNATQWTNTKFDVNDRIFEISIADGDVDGIATQQFVTNYPTPADGDIVGKFAALGKTDTSSNVQFGNILFKAEDVTHATRSGSYVFRVREDGSFGTGTEYLGINDDNDRTVKVMNDHDFVISSAARIRFNGAAGNTSIGYGSGDRIVLEAGGNDVLTMGSASLDPQVNLVMTGNDILSINSMQSSATPIGTTGFMRMGNNQGLTWRNVAGTANYRFRVSAADDFDVIAGDDNLVHVINLINENTGDLPTEVSVNLKSVGTTTGVGAIAVTTSAIKTVWDIVDDATSATHIEFHTREADVLNEVMRLDGIVLDMLVHKIINVVDPTLAQDAATKQYVDDQIGSGVHLPIGGGTLTGELRMDTGIDIVLSDSGKLYTDGKGNDFFGNVGNNFMEWELAGTRVLSLSTTTLNLGSGIDLDIEATDKLFLDGGGDTYISEASANEIVLTTGAEDTLTITDGKVEIKNEDGGSLLQLNNNKVSVTPLTLGQIQGIGRTSTVEDFVYAEILFKNPDEINGTEDGSISLRCTTGGSDLDTYITLNSSSDGEVDFQKMTDFSYASGSSTVDPSTHGAPDDWLEVKIAGVTHFIPAYLAT